MTRMKEIIKIQKPAPIYKTKFYRGKRSNPDDENITGRSVVVGVKYSDGTESIIGVLKHRFYHSPTGFNWGYRGSGPADLARSILWDHLEEEPPRALYMTFKEQFVSGWKDEWQITSEEIQNWIDERRKK